MSSDPIRCCDGCGRSVSNQPEAENKAWHFLQISKRWRCPACARELAQANQRAASLASQNNGKDAA